MINAAILYTRPVMNRLPVLWSCFAIGCAVAPSPASRGATSSAGNGATATTAGATSSPTARGGFIASYRPSAMWNARGRDDIPHGWPQDAQLRPAREVDYAPGSGALRVGTGPDPRGKIKTISASSPEPIVVVWIADYVTARPCPRASPGDSLLLAAPYDSIRGFMAAREADLAAGTPKVVLAAVPVEVECAELSDPQWVARHSATWRPRDADKRRRRVLGEGAASEEELAPVRVLSSAAQVEQHYAQRLPGRSIPGLEGVDFQRYRAVPLGGGAPRLQYVHPDAVQTEQVWSVEVPLTTSACRPRQAQNLAKLVYLADDTGHEPGRYRVESSPLFIRPKDDSRHELRFAECTAIFPWWRLMTTHVEPNPSMYLRLYGSTPAKERKYEDQIVSTLAVTKVGDTLNLSIPLLSPITCPESGGSRKAAARALTEAHMVRRAVLRRRLELPYHNGPIRLVSSERHPYDAAEWNIDARPCSDQRAP